MSDSEEKQLLEEQAAEAIKEEKKAAPKVYFSKVSKFNSLNLEKITEVSKIFSEKRSKTKE